MLEQAAQQNSWRRKMGRVCGDAERLPLAGQQFDLVFSNLALQWCVDLGAAIAEFQRVLKPGGLLMFSSFGPLTLNELRYAWAQVDDRVHVNQFVDMHDVGDAMLAAGLMDPVVDVERMSLRYTDVHALMRDLKGMGAHNINPGRAAGLTTPARLKKMLQAYETFRGTDGIPATFEAVYGHALACESMGSQTVSLSFIQTRVK
jgi:malonyl-CoA O-methyltransferase